MTEKPSREEVIAEAFKKAGELKNQGMPAFAIKAKIASTLVEKGIDGRAASVIANSLPAGGVGDETIVSSKDGMNRMVFGGLLCVAGIVLTMITHSMASRAGYYVVAIGPIIWGAVLFIKGYSDYSD